MTDSTHIMPVDRRADGHRLLGAFLCGVAFDLLFYDQAPGISHLLFLCVLYIYFYLTLQPKEGRLLTTQSLLLAPIVLLSATYMTFANPLFQALNTIAVPGLIAVHTTLLYGSSRHRWYDIRFLSDTFGQVVLESAAQLPQPVKLVAAAWRQRIDGSRFKEAGKVAIGLLIAAPFIAIVIVLLTSADSMFERMLGEVPNLFEGLRFDTVAAHVMLIGFITLALFCYVRGLLFPQIINKAEAGPVVRSRAAIDSTIAATVLTAFNAVYVLFAFVQFSYLFGGGAASLPDGATYAEYAKRGFAELVAVTVINFTLVMVILGRLPDGAGRSGKLLRALIVLLIGCTGVMLASAHYRLSMYEQAYGYTYIRLLTHAFMAFLLVLFLLALVATWRPQLPLVKLYAITAIAAYVIVNYINMDAVIAKSNIARYAATGKVDSFYLTGLSFDAAPYLTALYRQHGELPGLKDGLERMSERAHAQGTWPSFNWAKYRAAKALEEAGF